MEFANESLAHHLQINNYEKITCFNRFYSC